MRRFFTFLLFIGLCPCLRAQVVPYPDYNDLHSPLIDSILKTMSIEDMAAQTIILRSNTTPTAEYIVQMRQLLASHPFGGVCFFAGTTSSMLTLQQVYKQASKFPLFITIDGEFGPGMRLTDLKKLPRQQTMGAVCHDQIVYKAGIEAGRQCRQLGIQWNFLPVVDVNNNPRNPVINTRSFGEDPQQVAHLASLFLKGMQQCGVMGSAKHFPGHGDTETDSHKGLPLLRHPAQVLDSIHLLPFKKLIAEGVESVMVGHLNIPAYDSSGLPASLSPYVVGELLRKELGFEGLIVTDGLEMAGVRTALQNLPRYTQLGEGMIEVAALNAGCDVLLLPVNPLAAVKAITKAVQKDILPRSRLEDAVRRILYYKTRSGFLENYRRYPSPQATHNLPAFLRDSLNGNDFSSLVQGIYNQSVTLLENDRNILPVSPWAYPSTLCINIGDGKSTEFLNRLRHYDKDVQELNLPRDFSSVKWLDSSFLGSLKKYHLIFVGITNTNYSPAKNYGITKQTIDLVEKLQGTGVPVVLSVFAPPYAMLPFYRMNRLCAIICGYQEVEESQRACADLIFGALPACGKLPVSVERYWPAGYGLHTSADRLLKRRPEEIGLECPDFSRIDSIIQTGLDEHAYPGCQVLIARKGAVLYDKCFGFESYDSTAAKITPESIYDVASLTKILATTLAYMRLYENGDYRLDEPVREVIPRLANTNKRFATFRQMLSHQAGLKAFLPYVEDSVFNGKPVFDTVYSHDYPVQVARNLFLQNGYERHIRRLIDDSPINNRRPYLYSDLGFYYLNEALQKLTDTTLEGYTSENFYQYLELKNTAFHPLQEFPLHRIVPTENDTVLRHRLLHGFVHDPLAALIGGVSGSAGLFSNSHDVAVICQMLLQKGIYGGIRYFDSCTVDLFTSSNFSQADNRRGGGFDKPPLKPDQTSPTCPSASPASYGHSGYTGTYCWVDPEKDLIYVFLSNRVHPSSKNRKISQLNIRTSILECLYEDYKDK